jgi:hypothetical protein
MEDLMYVPAKKAASICGYSHRHFMRLVAEYDIPRYGPGSNRFLVSDLHLFMENPHAFKAVAKSRHRHGAFTPVAA